MTMSEYKQLYRIADALERIATALETPKAERWPNGWTEGQRVEIVRNGPAEGYPYSGVLTHYDSGNNWLYVDVDGCRGNWPFIPESLKAEAS